MTSVHLCVTTINPTANLPKAGSNLHRSGLSLMLLPSQLPPLPQISHQCYHPHPHPRRCCQRIRPQCRQTKNLTVLS